MKISLKTICIFLGLAVLVMLGISEAFAIEGEDSVKTKEYYEQLMIEHDIKHYGSKVPQLIKEFQDTARSPEFREEHAYYLGLARDPRSIPPLIEALDDKWPQVRRGTIHGLEIVSPYLKSEEEIIPHLKEALAREKLPGIQLEISRVLIRWGEEEVVIPFLFEIFKNANEFFIKSKESPSYYDTLIIKDKKGNIKKKIVKTERREPIEGTATRRGRVRKGWHEAQQRAIAKYPGYALHMLIELGNDKVIAGLEECLNYKDEWIRQKAKWALEEIKGRKKEEQK